MRQSSAGSKAKLPACLPSWLGRDSGGNVPGDGAPRCFRGEGIERTLTCLELIAALFTASSPSQRHGKQSVSVRHLTHPPPPRLRWRRQRQETSCGLAGGGFHAYL